MKASIILAVHDRIDDLDAHLDILDFAPKEWGKIIIWSHPNTPVERVNYWKQRVDEVAKIEGVNFSVGPLLAFTTGIRIANKLNCDYCVYRNADDWLFNHESVINRIKAVADNGFLFAGYNWVSHNSMKEFALNEVTCHVPTFAEKADAMDRSFVNSSVHMLCEFKLARWVNKLIKPSKFLRLIERERYPGVGHDLETLAMQEGLHRQNLPPNWRELWANNHRFFNKEWQLIGSHCQDERYTLYKHIRNDIKYRDDLETKTEFRRWILAAQKKLLWNLPTAYTHHGSRKIPTSLQKSIRAVPMFIPSIEY